jgi:hypothetical protein
MSDRFGVPDNMFGAVPDDFYGLVGRIALVSTLLEDKVMTMLGSLDTKPHPTYAGLPTSQVVPQIRKTLKHHAEVLGEDLVVEIDEALTASTTALNERHALVHSLWPNPTMEKAQGWRSKRVKGSEHGSEIIWTETSKEKLQTCLDELVRMSAVVVATTSKVWGVRGTQTQGLWTDD